MAALEGWGNFHVIVGAAAGALIGLQFVVMTLIATTPITGRETRASGTFSTPTVVHFAAVLFLSALISAPWQGMAPVAVLWGLVGLGGVGFVVLVAREMRLQTTYQPVLEDWLFHVLLPLVAYAELVVAAVMAFPQPRQAMFFLGAVELLLLFIGIHNAWDIVTYHVFVKRLEGTDKQ